MDNPFKKILHNEELPKVLKEKVLDDVAMIKLSLDMADLFVVKYPTAIVDLLGGGAQVKGIKEDEQE
ncbi:hypothetical protein P8625_14815 [Tenacibaculum tangerinum]|uniref:Uncharacterized protein n=1 Tax=Tenacibaculum tangerinum TaxID=3038772 RepID=A0ABY8L1J2_9FLAO|nr:hypothetical protein [Tenacibaculum tangerinum]WGH75326.1 hypothetical protein P8625_14815 [Tenacibaculum tangerinum]